MQDEAMVIWSKTSNVPIPDQSVPVGSTPTDTDDGITSKVIGEVRSCGTEITAES